MSDMTVTKETRASRKSRAADPFKAPRRNKLTMKRKDAIAGLLFILPFIIGFIFFFLLPIIQSIRYSLSYMSVSTNNTGYVLHWVGFDNYARALFEDPDFNKELVGSIGGMLLEVPLVLIFSFFMANVLNQKFHGRAFARAVLFLPVIITAGVILGLEADDTMIVAGRNALAAGGSAGTGMEVSQVQRLFDLGMFLRRYTNLEGAWLDYLSDAVNGIYDIVIASGVQILIFLAGLQSISPSLYEASNIEGATPWENFWKITFPMLSPLILVNTVYTVVDSFVKDTNTMMDSIYTTIFTEVDYGFGSAMAWIYFLVVIIIMGILALLISRWVFYYD